VTEEETAVRARITGRVQGVFFRAWTDRTAKELGLKGFVRNRRDGSVEALFAGPAAQVNEMLTRCRSGPPDARVEHVETETASGTVPDRFEVKPTV